MSSSLHPIRYPDTGRVHPWPTGEDVVDPKVPPTRVWVPESPLLVLGYSQTPEKEIDLEAAEAHGVPVYKRRGGGGAVYLDAGCVCVALRLRKRPDWGIRDYFAAGNGFLSAALEGELGLRTVARGISDLAVETPMGERKISGSSLHLPRECAVYLASVLVSVPMARIDRYLRHPSREPDYRERRPHGDFLANVSGLPGMNNLSSARLRKLLETRAEFQKIRALAAAEGG